MSSLRQANVEPFATPSIVPSCTQHQNTEIFHTKIHTVSWICVMLIEFDGKFDHPSRKPNKTIEELPQHSQPSQGFHPPFFEVLKSSPFPFRKGNPRHRANDSVGNFLQRCCTRQVFLQTSYSPFQLFFRKLHHVVWDVFSIQRLVFQGCFTSIVFQMLGFFFSTVGVSWGGSKPPCFFQMLGVLFFKMGGFSRVFQNLDFLKKLWKPFIQT